MRVAKALLVLSVAVTVAFVFVTDCAKKPKPAIESSEVVEETIEEPEATPPPEEVKKPEEEQPTAEQIDQKFQDIHFAYDKDSIRPDAVEILNDNAKVMLEYPWIKIQIQGNCDERGTVEYNLALGERRAGVVRDYLVGLGVDAFRIRIVSYGEEDPVDPGHTEQAWAKNRRAESVIISD